MVHDQAEHALLKEVEVVRNCENKLEHFTDKCNNQVSTELQFHINYYNHFVVYSAYEW